MGQNIELSNLGERQSCTLTLVLLVNELVDRGLTPNPSLFNKNLWFVKGFVKKFDWCLQV